MHTPPDSRRGAPVDHPWAAPLASAMLVCLLFYPIVHHSYVYDGVLIVGGDDRLDEPMFGLRVWGAQWWPQGTWVPISRPFTQFTFWVQAQLHGRDFSAPQFNPFHAVDLALFALLSGLVAHLTRRFMVLASPSPASGGVTAAPWLVGLAFAAHPLHTEVVASVVGRADVLAMLFTVAGLIGYLSWRDGMTWKRASALGALILLGGLCKENGYLLAPMLAGVEIGLRRSENRPLFSGNVPWRLIVTILVVVVIAVAQRQVMTLSHDRGGGVPEMDNPLVLAKGPAEQVLTRVQLVGKAAQLSAWPIRADPDGELPLLPAGSPDYSPRMLMPTDSPTEPHVLGGLAVILGWLALGVLSWWRRRAVVAVLLCWPLAWFIPSNVVVMIGTIFGERLLLPITLFVPLAMVMLVPWRSLGKSGGRAVVAVACVWVMLLSAATFLYVPVFRNNDTLQAYTVSRHPRSGRFQAFFAMTVVGHARVAEGEMKVKLLDAAEQVANKAIGLWPRNSAPYAVLGAVEVERGNKDRAREYLEYASRGTMRPDFAEFYLRVLGDMDDQQAMLARIEQLRAKLEENPGDDRLLRELAITQRRAKEWDDAEQTFAKLLPDAAAIAQADDIELLDEYLAVLIGSGQTDTAVTVYRRLIELEPNQWSHYADAAMVALSGGDAQRYHAEVERWIKMAMALSPGSPEPWAAWCELRFQLGDRPGAVAAIQEALRRSGPDDFKRPHYLQTLEELNR